LISASEKRAARRSRASSSRHSLDMSSAIIIAQPSESSAVQRAGAGARVMRNSGGSGPRRVSRCALMPAT
jgi:hypothetical protein